MISFLRSLAVLAALCHLTNCKRGQRINTWSQEGGDITQLKFRSTDVLRNALKRDATNKWNNIKQGEQFVVPYIITGDYDPDEIAVIKDAMTAIERNTCVLFKERNDEADFIEIQNQPFQGCFTVVGRVPGKNVVQLEANNMATCIEHDIVIHELLHTLGVWHEQMRYDRDKYIRVIYDNIPTNLQPQFAIISDAESTTYGEPYDYTSVMHYPKDAFSKQPGQITMQTLDQKYQDVIGVAKTASASDYHKICIIYGCTQCIGQPFQDSGAQPLTTTTAATTASPSREVCSSQDSFASLCPLVVAINPSKCQVQGSFLTKYCCQTCLKKISGQ